VTLTLDVTLKTGDREGQVQFQCLHVSSQLCHQNKRGIQVDHGPTLHCMEGCRLHTWNKQLYTVADLEITAVCNKAFTCLQSDVFC